LPRPAVRRRVLEGVAVGVQEIGVAVAIQIDHREPAGAEVGVGGSPQEPRREAAAAGIDERPDLLPFLADQRHEIGTAVTVEVGG